MKIQGGHGLPAPAADAHGAIVHYSKLFNERGSRHNFWSSKMKGGLLFHDLGDFVSKIMHF